MTSMRLLLAAFAVLLVAGTARPQAPPSPDESETDLRRAVAIAQRAVDAEAQESATERAEDQEVMRRILHDGLNRFYARYQTVTSQYCGQCHGMGAARLGERRAMSGLDDSVPYDKWVDAMLASDQYAHVFARYFAADDAVHSGKELFPVRSVFSTHLAGYGVVFQLEAPRLRDGGPQGAAPSPVGAPRPLTNWEKTRRELSGQGAEDEKAAAAEPQPLPTRADLVEQLIGLLGDNGHNFRRLAPTERVAIAITFRGSVDPRLNWAVHAKAVGDVRKAESSQLKRPLNPIDELILRRWIAEGETRVFSDVTKGEQNEHELAGDLHFRQGQFDKAIEEFQKAIDLSAGGDVLKALDAAKLKADQVKVLEKAAQAMIGAGKYEEAKALLEKIAAWRTLQIGDDQTFLRRTYLDIVGLLPTPDEVKAFLDEKSADKRQKLIDALVLKATERAKEESADTEPVLPPRLVVSATKAHLDDVASGKLARDEFRKVVEISYSSPGAPTALNEKRHNPGGTP
ncbi:MAG: DUF1549 domain-containing protein [Planctomycetia bacterium]|nr:DUF1549 domain-containing protein [Planctomycetia bacterium]